MYAYIHTQCLILLKGGNSEKIFVNYNLVKFFFSLGWMTISQISGIINQNSNLRTDKRYELTFNQRKFMDGK